MKILIDTVKQVIELGNRLGIKLPWRLRSDLASMAYEVEIPDELVGEVREPIVTASGEALQSAD